MRALSYLRLSSLLLLAGCASRAGVERSIASDSSAVPPNTVMLSQMMRELSAQPGFTDQLLSFINKGEKNGAFLTPELFDTFRKLVLGKDWSGLDRFPGWTIHRVTQTVHIGESLMSKSKDAVAASDRVQIGPYTLDKAMTASLDTPSDRPGFSDKGLVTKLTDSVTNGDGADPKIAPMHAESARLAEVMNRLSLNGYQSTAPFAASISGQTVTTPQQLVQALVETGHEVTVADARYFANFGHFHYNGEDVEMPFFLDSQISVSTDHWWQRSHRLLVPVAHAEYEWFIRGPKINADITFYFGIDGRAEFRTNDQLNQPWVMGRHAHEYIGADAIEVTRLTGQMLRAYAYLHAAHPQLPFGGYYTLGVCQDVVGAIEQRMTGRTTLFPNTAKTELFRDQPDDEITKLMEAVPKDTGGAPPAFERIFGSLPTTDMNAITVPGLRDDLIRSQTAWQQGDLHHRYVLTGQALTIAGVLIASGLVLWLLRFRRSRR
ncbi:hypothetical protein [Terriglobus roseus]|uniref:Uncharacterized protein n=1 Tax=Terriglobus roseus TaxID=392734 RepID=A0A1H4PYU5_9BACT|nr:hypothetical protein [Terriglobus roseus]SEC12546.1 hypothetical protein SAMN05443244_2716 [Terriglobus roseus]